MATRTFQHSIPLDSQARFTLVAVFREVQDYEKYFTLPFDMMSICLRAEGDRASVTTNLATGEVYRARENDITLIPHNLPQRYRHTPRAERYCIHFRLELHPGVDVFGGVRRRIVENSPALRREADAIFAERDTIRLLARCQEFALRFCLRHWPKRYPFDEERVKPFAPVLRFIRSEADARTGVAELAAMMHCSTGHFTRSFHAAFGLSPKLFLQRELFRKTAEKLAAPGATVQATAHAFGFSSEFYFSKFFKRLGGVSPRDYAARARPPVIK